ncbi:MAG TPA: peptidylprolyl isomerase [Pirellulales bacterium]
MNRCWIVFLLALGLLASVGSAQAQTAAELLREELRAIGQQKPPDTVVARIDGEPITAAEVNRLMKVAMQDKKIIDAALPMIEATALDQVIKRRLVTKFLDSKKIEVSEAEVDAIVKKREEALTKQGGSMTDYLAVNGFTKQAFHEDQEWQLRWEKAIRTYLTEANLEKYFEAHRKEFDGTEVRVSQILLRPNGTLDVDRITTMTERAKTIRDSIIGELTTFPSAAKKYSEAPSRAQGGDIGFIPRHGLMDEDFAAAAFALEPGEISEPVLTKYGAHLIQVTEIRPGKKTARQVRNEIEPAVRKEGFEKIAKQMLKSTPVEFTGASPYLNPETGDLILDEKDTKKLDEAAGVKPK